MNSSPGGSGLNSNQKAVLLGGAACLAALIAGYVLYKQTKKPKEEIEPEIQKETKEKEASETVTPKGQAVPEQKKELAVELKEKGNEAFRQKDYEGAIRYYTEALSCVEMDAHLIYSNRSAAFYSLGRFKEAQEDAIKCIQLVPEWPKGYFRLGKALHELKDMKEAYKKLYKGFLLDPKSEEIKRLLETVEKDPSLAESDPRALLEAEVIKSFQREVNENLCKEMGTSLEIIHEIVQRAVETNSLDSLLENETLKPLMENHSTKFTKLIAEELIHLEKFEFADDLVTAELEKAPNAMLLILQTESRSRRSSKADVQETFKKVYQAFTMDPTDPFVATMFLSLLQRILEYEVLDLDLFVLMENLGKAFNLPNSNKILIGHCGIGAWFKFFSDPKISNELLAAQSRYSTPDQLYSEELVRGIFHKLYLDPFLLEILSQILLLNPTIESLFGPARAALVNFKSGDDFKVVSPLVWAIGMQEYRDNYLWTVNPDERDRIEQLRDHLSKLISKGPEQLVTDGILDEAFSYRLSLLAMYENVGKISGVHSIVSQVDLQKHHPILALLLKSCVLNLHREQAIKYDLEPLTTISDSESRSFYNDYVPVWDNVNQTLSKIHFDRELQLFFPKYSFQSKFGGNLKFLVAGCGSGSDLLQFSTLYSDNIELHGIDISENRIAFGKRAFEDLGIKNISIYQADISLLDPSKLPQYDVIFSPFVISYLEDPLKGWKNLGKILKPGGLMRLVVHSKTYIDMIAYARNFLADKFTPPVFDSNQLVEGYPLPRVLRSLSTEEIMRARTYLMNGSRVDAKLVDLILHPSFYSLPDFMEMLFHPHVVGLTFTTIMECLKELGLKLVGFEFSNLSPDTLLRYQAKYDDEQINNPESLDQFEQEDPQNFKTFLFGIQFLCEKPL